MKLKTLNSKPALWTFIIVLIGALIVVAIEFKSRDQHNSRLVKEKAAASEAVIKKEKAFSILKSKCDSLEKQCTAVKELRQAQEDALFTYIKKNYKTVSDYVAKEIAKQTVSISAELGAPFVVVVGIMEVESSFNPAAVSHAGARGLMQVMPKFWVKEFDFLDNGYDLHEIDQGIRAGVEVYLEYFEATKKISGALARYFGKANVGYEEKVFKAISEFTFHMAERS